MAIRITAFLLFFLTLGATTSSSTYEASPLFNRRLYESDSNGNSQAIEFRDLYFIGWSRDSKIAYVTWKGEEDALGACSDLRVFVQDLTTDNIVWKYSYFKEGEESTFANVWREHLPEFEAKLREYGIVGTEERLHYFPLTIDNRSIDCEAVLDADPDINETDYSAKDYRIIARSAPGGEKVLSSATNVMGLVGVDVYGYVRSPYEDRIAVLAVLYYRGWEGPPLPAEPTLIGCHLSRGFR